TSHTAAFSEKVRGLGKSNRESRDEKTPSASVLDVPWFGSASTQGYHAACSVRDPHNPATPLHLYAFPSGSIWYSGPPPVGRYNHVMPPNPWSCEYGIDRSATGRFLQFNGAWTASSRHAGLVNVLMADGSVRPVKDTIAIEIWWALGTRNGGEVISADAY